MVRFSGRAVTVSNLIWDTKFMTAIAVLNPSFIGANISVTARDQAGHVMGSSSISLAPGAMKTFLQIENGGKWWAAVAGRL